MSRSKRLPLVVGAACVALSIFSVPAYGVDTVVHDTAFQQRLDDQLTTLSNRYNDIKKELQEEYQAITQEKDENCQAIFEKVKDLKQKKADAEARYQTSYREFEKKMRSANLSAADKQYLDAVKPLETEQDTIQLAYDNTLASLQQLYQLNDKRFNELLKIHNAREALEENRYREERDYIAERTRQERRANRGDMTTAEQRSLRQSQQALATLDAERKARYENSLRALDEYKSVVNNRITAQRDYFREQASLMNDLAQPGVSPENRAEYMAKLADLNNRRNADERLYQNSVRYIEEMLAFDQLRGRQTAALTEEVNEIELEWGRINDEYNRQRTALDTQLNAATLTADARTNIEGRRNQLIEAHKQREAAYRLALQNIAERRDLMEKSLDNRQAYLKDRNDIRQAMAQAPVTDENFTDYRQQIAQLEERRIQEERDIRNQILALNNGMPDGFKVTPWQTGDMQVRKDRVLGRLDSMRQNIDANWQREKQHYDAELRKVQALIAAPNQAPAEKARYEKAQTNLQSALQKAEQKHQETIKALEDRKQKEEERITARAEYMAQRTRLMNEMSGDDVGYNVMADYNQKIRALDTKWAAREKQYRSEMKPLGSLLPASTDEDALRAESQKTWDEAMERIDAATTRNANANARRAATRRVSRDDNETLGESVKDAWESVKASVRGTYNDAVHYLTD